MKKGLIFATTLAMALGVGAAVGAHQGKVASVAEAYGADENYWFVAGTFNDWTLQDTHTHLTYSKLTNNNWEYESDEYIQFEEGDEFKFVYSWGGTSQTTNYVTPNLMTNSSDFTGGNGSNFVAAKDIKVKFFLQIYGSSGDWMGVYWEEYAEPDEPDTDGYYIVGTKSNWKYDGATKMDAGTDGNKAQKLRYQASAGEELQVRSYLSGEDTLYGSKYTVDASKLLDIYLNGEGVTYISETAPDSEGYYMQCTVNGEEHWGYFNGYKMVNTKFRGNVAYYRSFYLYANDELRVRSYYTDREPKGQWATVGNDTKTWGEPSGDNFKCKVAGYYDVYAKYESEVFKFYVAQHVDTFEVTIEAHLYEGSTFIEARYLDKQLAYVEEVDFMPEREAVEGYAFDGFYADSNYQTEYTAHEITGSTKIYAKYMRLGYYVVGDEAFAGTGKGWCMDGAVYLPAATNDTDKNLLEGDITIPASASEIAVAVRPAQIIANEDGEAVLSYDIPYSIAEYAFAKKVGDNIEFTKGGTFAVYVNKSYVVYLNEGAAAFYTKFLSETGNVCKTENTSNTERLKEVWSDLELAYDSLSKTEKDTIVAVGFDGGDEKGDDLHKVVARYAYIVSKYGSSEFKNFIWNTLVAAKGAFNNSMALEGESNSMLIVIISIAAVSAVALGTLLVIKKRKHN